MFGNCVRRINQIQFTKCLRNSPAATAKRLHASVAGGGCQSMQPMHTYSSPIQPHLTSLTAKTTVFTILRLQNNGGGQSVCPQRHFSSNSSNKNRNANARKDDDESDSDDDDDVEDWERKLPKFDNSHYSTPSIYFMVKNTLSTLLIRSYFDQQFSRQEFLTGAKKAVQVHSSTHSTNIMLFRFVLFILCSHLLCFRSFCIMAGSIKFIG